MRRILLARRASRRNAAMDSSGWYWDVWYIVSKQAFCLGMAQTPDLGHIVLRRIGQSSRCRHLGRILSARWASRRAAATDSSGWYWDVWYIVSKQAFCLGMAQAPDLGHIVYYDASGSQSVAAT